MKIGIIDGDFFTRYTKFPSIDAMKTSTYHKSKKDNVDLITELTPVISGYDKIYIFSDWTTIDLITIKNYNHNLSLHGRFFHNKYLPMPSQIELCAPDYSLYDKLMYKWILNNKVAPKKLRMVHNSICLRLTHNSKILMTKQEIQKQIEANLNKFYILIYDGDLNALELPDLFEFLNTFNKTIIITNPVSLATLSFSRFNSYKYLRNNLTYKYRMRILFDMKFEDGIQKLANIKSELPDATSILLTNLPQILSVEVAPLIAHDILEKIYAIMCLNYQVRFTYNFPTIAYSEMLYSLFYYFLVLGLVIEKVPYLRVRIKYSFMKTVRWYRTRFGNNPVLDALIQYAKRNDAFFFLAYTVAFQGEQDYDLQRRIYKRQN